MKFSLSEYKIENDCMRLTFPFEIGKAFKSSKYSHPITVPSIFKEILIEKDVSNFQDIRFIVDGQLEFDAIIRSGWNNTTHYFQITSSVDQEIVIMQDHFCKFRVRNIHSSLTIQ